MAAFAKGEDSMPGSSAGAAAAAGEQQVLTLFDVLKPGELDSLINLKTRLAEECESYKFTDMAIVRFLRGRKHDEDKTFRALLRHITWRQELQVSSISPDDFKSEASKRKIVVSGYDKARRPVLYIFASRHRTSERDLKEMQSFIIHTLENAMRLTKVTEEKLVIVFDLSDFTLSSMDYDVVKLLVNILQFNYPEVLQVALIVNAPMLFSACWLIIRPWLDPITAAKATFIKKTQLSQYIDESEFPSDLQGEGTPAAEEMLSGEPAVDVAAASVVGGEVR